MSDPRVCRRPFGFGEHRSMGDVMETERLERAYRLRTIHPNDHKRLQSLQARATEPDREPPHAAA